MIRKPDGYSNDEFLFYLYKNKTGLGLSWDEIAEIMNQYENKSYSESRYRKYCAEYFKDQLAREIPDLLDTDELSIEGKFDIAKETQRLRDERTQLNALYRQMSREDSLRNIAIECAKIIAENHPIRSSNLNIYSNSNDCYKEGLLLLSDWHYGIEIDNHWNKYSPDICKSRLADLLAEVGNQVLEYGLKKITILNLGDLISGRIHSQIRIENREDVVSQVMNVSELLCSFIDDLATDYGVFVDYYDCLDNHSRIEPNKKESLRLESLSRFITWHLEERFKNVKNISIKFNEYSDEIISFSCLGWEIVGVHGDLDSMSNVVKHMRGMVKERPDLICTAHRHHFSADEENDCMIISNPSLMGTDQFAEKHRLTSRPAQTFIVVTDETPVYAIHRIVL